MIDPERIRTAVILASFLVAGIELGLAFLMRAPKEATSDDR